MKLSDGEKLILVMLRDLYKHLKVKGEIDHELVMHAIAGGHHWALEWQYPGIFEATPDSEELVAEVSGVLDVWSFLERGYSRLSAPERERVKKETGYDQVRFTGFDGNNEARCIGLARTLIDKLDRFSEFKDRDLNCHHPSIESHRRMVAAFAPIRKDLAARELAVDDIITILKARKAPSG